jgi:hypothetical protein
MTDTDRPFSKYAILRELSTAAAKNNSLPSASTPNLTVVMGVTLE